MNGGKEHVGPQPRKPDRRHGRRNADTVPERRIREPGPTGTVASNGLDREEEQEGTCRQGEGRSSRAVWDKRVIRESKISHRRSGLRPGPRSPTDRLAGPAASLRSTPGLSSGNGRPCNQLVHAHEAYHPEQEKTPCSSWPHPPATGDGTGCASTAVPTLRGTGERHRRALHRAPVPPRTVTLTGPAMPVASSAQLAEIRRPRAGESGEELPGETGTGNALPLCRRGSNRRCRMGVEPTAGPSATRRASDDRTTRRLDMRRRNRAPALFACPVGRLASSQPRFVVPVSLGLERIR